ncbi:MAG: SGNH/GDSL hydrolase family protein [Nannocystaceae bacterium]|nr:SGNH/GDSL hydrolase family protein [bacterium]
MRFGLVATLIAGTGCPAESEDAVGGTDGDASSSGSEPTSGGDPSGDPSGDPDPSDDGTTTSTDPDPTAEGSSSSGGTADPSGGEVCGEVPTRMMFFGDSLFACFGLDGGKDAPSCSARLSHEYLAETYAPGVTYENLAVSGAVTRDVVMDQMPGAPVGMPGHTLVVIWVGGNDISGLLLSSDAEAEATYRDELAPEFAMLWDEMSAWVDDPANFPDGATLIINTQFNPFDDCSASPFAFMSPLKTQLLAEYNEELRARVEAQPNAFLADQFPVFLGHGHHYATAECPHYDAENPYWMIGGADLVHPNGLGHVSMASTLRGTLDEIYACE